MPTDLPSELCADPDAPQRYDPAEYRWVPVRRQPRFDGWTDEKQRRFIEVLADTGIVSIAAKAVGMSRESARKLRRSPHGAAFARAWDAARLHAGALLEDIAFERAIEGTEQPVHDEYGSVICTKRVYNNRLLTFLLGALKPERYARSVASPLPAAAPSLEASLRAMEPQLPAPAEALLGAQTLADELDIADSADGILPHFLCEQRPAKSPAQQEAAAFAAQQARGKAIHEGDAPAGPLSDDAFRDLCAYLDPTQAKARGRKHFR